MADRPADERLTRYELHRIHFITDADAAAPVPVECNLCEAVIAESGGPGKGPICARCAVALKTGLLRGFVFWTDDGPEPGVATWLAGGGNG